MSLGDILAEEDAAREKDASRIRTMVAAIYAVGGDTKLCVPTAEVHDLVRDDLGARVLSGPYRGFINEIVVGMGAQLILHRNTRMFAGMRRLVFTLKEAIEFSRAARRNARYLRPPLSPMTGHAGSMWDTLLHAEGMPDELPMIQRGGSVEAVERRSIMSRHQGVHRQGESGARVELSQGHVRAAEDAVSKLDLERRVMRLRAAGYSLRKIGVALGLDKMTVDKVVKSVLSRYSETVAKKESK